MPFAIGKAFSDETLALAQRERESQRQAALESYNLELRRRAQMSADKNSGRELDLRYDALSGEGEDRKARLEMARADRSLNERKMNLDSSQFDRGLSQKREEFATEAGQRDRQIDLGGREQDFRESQGTRQLELGEAELGLKAEHNDWERTEKFPTEAGLKQLEITRKQDADENRARLIDAQVQNLSAKTSLTMETAKQVMANLQIKDAQTAISYGRLLIDEYDKLANGINGPGDPETVKYAQEKMTNYLAALSKADPGAYGITMRALGTGAARATGSPFAQSGYGSAGSVMDELLKRAKEARNGKPPPVPTAGK